MNLNSRSNLIARIRRSKKTRTQFVASHIARTLAFQVRALRQRAELTQQELGESIGSNQNSIYRLESAVASPNISYLKKLAAKFDVALIIRFAPYGELVDWVSGTPRVERGLRTASLEVASFDDEFGETASKPDDIATEFAVARHSVGTAEATQSASDTTGRQIRSLPAKTQGQLKVYLQSQPTGDTVQKMGAIE